ncbi:glycoside hydrolase family 88 protein [Apiospora sp. TS-2023a]
MATPSGAPEMASGAPKLPSNISQIYDDNVVAKILQVAQREIQNNKTGDRPSRFPDTVPQSGPGAGRYICKEKFWTCGFFPGSIYLILERLVKFPDHCAIPYMNRDSAIASVRLLAHAWSGGIEWMSGRTDTHDLGFLIQLAFQKDWELFGSEQSLKVLEKAAWSLASRYDPGLGSIRSWNQTANKRYSYTSLEDNFLVIIDSVCNLDLLFYIGYHSKYKSLVEMATSHAHKLRLNHLRPDFSTFHVVNFDPKSGEVKAKFTAQGYEDQSVWSRGQAWSILGFAQVYTWTKDPIFLETAIGCANLFVDKLATYQGRHHHPFVPPWDFSAPDSHTNEPLRDSSAAVIAAVGMLHIHSSLALARPGRDQENIDAHGSSFLQTALRIVSETLDLCLDRDLASFLSPGAKPSEYDIPVAESGFDAILRQATAHNNPDAFEPNSDHGSVYADYFTLEFGNLLLRNDFFRLC